MREAAMPEQSTRGVAAAVAQLALVASAGARGQHKWRAAPRRKRPCQEIPWRIRGRQGLIGAGLNVAQFWQRHG